MATPSSVLVQARSPAKERYGPTDWMGGWKTCLWGSLAVVLLTALPWWYTSRYAWSAGIDAASPEFARNFRTLFWTELIVVAAGTGLSPGGLVRAGTRPVYV